MDFRFQGKGVGCVEACITLYAIEIRENTIFTKGLSHAIEEVVPSVIKQIVSDLK